MKIPFSTDEFLNVFENYNRSVWPIQIVFYLLALSSIVLIFMRSKHSSTIAMYLLAFFWLWMGLFYHIIHFSGINPAAYLFGAVFLLQGILILYFGAIRKTIQLAFTLNMPGILALVFLAYALFFYPLIGYGMGHVYPRAPTFGVPCPTVIFTFGMLLLSVNRIPWYMIIIPLLWSLVGFSAAINLSIQEDYGLVIAGLVAIVILPFYRTKNRVKI